MLWAIVSIDKSNSTGLRNEHMKAHSAYLKEHDDVIFFTGPLQSDDATANIGSLWIINVDSREAAKAFSDGEAFTKAGVFASIMISRTRRGHFHPELAGTK